MILRVPIIMDIFTLTKYSAEEMLLPGKDAVTEIQEEKNMAETVRVVVDAMGGDNAPAEPVKAAVEAVTERDDIVVILTGKQEVIESELSKFQNYPKERIQVVNATEVIETAEPPVVAIRKKKDSSIVVADRTARKNVECVQRIPHVQPNYRIEQYRRPQQSRGNKTGNRLDQSCRSPS